MNRNVPPALPTPPRRARRTAAVLALLIALLPGACANPDASRPPVLRAGNRFGCAPGDPGDAPLCERIGPLRTGMTLADVTRIAGPALFLTPERGGHFAHVINLGAETMLRVTVNDDTVIGIFVMGPVPRSNWTFGDIGIGMTEAALRERFGAPQQVVGIPPQQHALLRDGGVVWNYQLWRFRAQLAHGRVIAIGVGIID